MMASSETGSGKRAFGGPLWLLLAGASLLALVVGFKINGDELIHVVLMENAAAGHWFEFNRGVPDAASTSIFWTLIGALFWSLGGPTLTVIGLKAICFLCFSLKGWLVAQLSFALGSSRAQARLAAAAVILIASSFFTSLSGMENAFFTVLILAAFSIFSSQLRSGELDTRRTVVIFGILGLSCITRPEGFVISFVFALLWLSYIYRFERERVLVLFAVAAGSGLAIILPAWLFHYATTGQWIPSSGVSRMMYARRDPYSLQLGPLWLYGRALAYLAAYAPLLILALVGVRSGLRRSVPPPQRMLVSVIAATVGAVLILYIFVTGAAHASRYLIPIFALLGVLASLGIRTVLSLPRRNMRLAILAIAALWFLGVAGADAYLRFRSTLGQYTMAKITGGPEFRRERTDEMLPQICAYGCCKEEGAVAVSLTEVQVRYFLDDRIEVVATDGVTVGPFNRPTEYLADGCPRFENIEEDPKIVAILENPLGGGTHLQACGDNPWARRVSQGWREGGNYVPGWAWRSDPRMLVRVCTAR